jgi:acyl-CoA thioesterase II
VGAFEVDTRVEGGEGRYRAAPSEDWRIWGPMGGYVASIALRAAAAEVVGELLPATFQCQFFSPAEFREVDLVASVRRATRRTTAVAVSMTQDDRPVLDAQVWFAAEDDLVTHDHSSHHGLDGPDGYPPIDELVDPDEEPPFPFWQNFDTRPVSWVKDWESYEGGEPWWANWLRFAESPTFDDPVLEACRLVVVADLPSYPAASRAHPTSFSSQWVAPNLDLSVQFHRLSGLSEWLLSVGIAPVADRGLIGFRSEVWTSDHLLVATGSGQLLTRRVPTP